MRNRAPVLVVGALVLLSGGAISGCADPAPAPPPGLERYYDQRLDWGPCPAKAAPGLECARLEVPLDYAAPAGRTASLALLRRPATGSDRTGSLVVNPGGPGDSGLELAATLADDLDAAGSGLAGFDVVGFDPRGVGSSTPAIDCDTDAAIDADRADADYDPSAAGVARDEKRARDRAQRCAERSGGADVLAHAGTRDVVRDLDVLRAALGDRGLTYLGYSYGTRIGAGYARAFPDRVRAMVLDGAFDPKQDAADRAVKQAAGFQRSFQAYADACVKAPACPLGTVRTRATAAFQALTRPLITRPAKVPGDRRGLSYSDAVTGTEQALYDSDDWPKLTAALSKLRAGDGTNLLRLADEYYGRGPDGDYGGNSAEAQLVINCMDSDQRADRAAEATKARRVAAAAPFADPGRGASGARTTCAFLPPAADPAGPAPGPAPAGLPPVLVVSTTGDPATPYQAGVDLAAGLRAALLTVVGDRHTAVATGLPCVDDAVVGYLRRPADPVTTTRCEPSPDPTEAAPAKTASGPK
jgi:pimeloyl-ACP methyl ester carboxylesterase